MNDHAATRIVIADDHPIFREGLRRYVEWHRAAAVEVPAPATARPRRRVSLATTLAAAFCAVHLEMGAAGKRQRTHRDPTRVALWGFSQVAQGLLQDR